MTRPSGAVPVHASTATYPPSSNPWSNTATKIDPGASLQAGYEPKKRPPAQLFNWLLNRLGLFLVAYDCIDAQNWFDKGGVGIGNIQAGKPVAVDPTTQMLWLVGATIGTPGIYSSPGDPGFWTEDTSNTGVTHTVNCGAIAFSSIDGFMWAGGNAQTFLISRDNAGTYTKVTLANSTGVLAVLFHASEALPFAFFGNDNNGHPAVWRGNETSVSVVPVTVSNAATYTGKFAAAAVGPTRTVAFAACTAPVNQIRQWDTDVWTNPFFDRGPVVFASNPVDIVWSASSGAFVVTCAGGQVYASTDGFTWILQSTNVTWQYGVGCLAARGGVLVAAIKVTPGNVYWMVYSTDIGVTWTKVPYPVSQATVPGSVVSIGDAFLLVTGGNGTRTAVSLRAV